MEERLLLAGYTTGEAIREYLLTLGEGYPYGFYKLWRQFKKVTSYQAVRRYFWILKEIGLIESVRYEKSRGHFRKHFYRIVPRMEDDPRWGRPQAELYPDTRLGKRRYDKLRERGLKPRGGRRAPYRS